jgi:hypothetical protein
LGPAILALLAYAMATAEKSWFAARSIAFLVVLILVVVARWTDPLNSFGEPSTPDVLKRYVIGAVGIGIVVWVLANLLGNQFLAQ